MHEWERLVLAASSIIVFVTISILLIWRFYCLKQNTHNRDSSQRARTETLQLGIAKLHQVGQTPSPQNQLEEALDTNKGRKSSGNYHVLNRGASAKPLFNWVDHPSLITDAVENGWSRFGFTSYMASSSSKRSNLLRMCGGGEFGKDGEMDISWEVCQGSADFMQKIRLNPGFRKSTNFRACSKIIRTALPLPGPPLGNSAFPQEAYFEITILYCRGGCNDQEYQAKAKVNKEGEKTKLILPRGVSVIGIGNFEELKLGGGGGKDHGREVEDVCLCLGLSIGVGGSLPLKLPGRYPGSIGFNTNGSVFLDGIEHAFQSEKTRWAKPNKVIGCGYDPRQKKVFFTVDAEVVHVIHCKSEEFGTPLYPTIATNNEIEVLVNFGQSAFNYAPANLQRTPNPCFIGPIVKSPALGYEDSKELFSMGRIDSEWLSRNSTKGNNTNHISNVNGVNYPVVDFDEESDADLFEIVLDESGRSPVVPLL